MNAPASPITYLPATATKGIDAACVIGARRGGAVTGRCPGGWRVAAKRIDETGIVFPEGFEESSEMAKDTLHPANVSTGVCGGSLRGRRHRRTQEKAETHQDDQTPKHTHTSSLSGRWPEQAAIGRAAGLQSAMVPRMGVEIPARAMRLLPKERIL